MAEPIVVSDDSNDEEDDVVFIQSIRKRHIPHPVLYINHGAGQHAPRHPYRKRPRQQVHDLAPHMPTKEYKRRKSAYYEVLEVFPKLSKEEFRKLHRRYFEGKQNKFDNNVQNKLVAYMIEELTKKQEIDALVQAHEGVLQSVSLQVNSIFPTVCPDYLNNLLRLTLRAMTQPNAGVEHKMPQNQMSKVMLTQVVASMTEKGFKEKRVERVQRDFSRWQDKGVINSFDKPQLYLKQTFDTLANQFPQCSIRFISDCLAQRNSFYLPTKALLLKHLAKNSHNNTQGKVSRRKLNTSVSNGSPGGFTRGVLGGAVTSVELLEELAWERKQEVLKQEEKDKEIAEKLMEEQAIKESAQIDCLCCFGEYAFESMTQCSEGHLFCKNCLKAWTTEKMFGMMQAGTELKCIDSSGCQGTFPRSMLKKALPEKIFAKWEHAQALNCVKELNIGGLFTCPHCEAVAQVPETVKIFTCPNSNCRKTTCKLCSKPSHIPYACGELESKAAENEATEARKKVEEEMTAALLRHCSCGKKFFKTQGCNVMSCPCGRKMCYACKQHIQGYNHYKNGKCPAGAPVYGGVNDTAAVKAAGKKALADVLSQTGNNQAKQKLLASNIEKVVKTVPRAPRQDVPRHIRDQFNARYRR